MTTVAYDAGPALARANQRIRELEQFLIWEDQLFAHQDLIPGVKLTMRELRRHPPEETADNLSPAPIEIWRIAKNTGVSEKTTGKNIAALHEHQVLQREEDFDPKAQKTQISVKLLDPFFHPRAIKFPERPKSGYHPPKPTCMKCGNELEIETAVLCPTCKRKHIVSSRPATAEDTELTERYNNLVRIDEQLSDTSDKMSDVSPAPEEETSDRIHIFQSEEVSNAFPDTPLTQDEQVAAAHLFLAIAGPGPKPEHVVMSKNGPGKYFTEHRALRLDDAYRHFRGVRTVGATLQHPDLQTRAIGDDADNAEDFERLKACALHLAQAGFKPIVAPSPVTNDEHAGGGHLWVIFDSLVNVYAARKTLCYYAPRLAESKEYWPNAEVEGINSRIRLPGGKYVKPGFEAWCPLYDAHEGNGTARVLLAFQSPSERLIICQKPDPPKPEPPPLLHTQPLRRGVVYLGESLTKQIIDDFNEHTTWQQLLGQPDSSGKYLASWRNDKTPNVSIHPTTDKAKDFSTKAWLDKAMDKYQVYCFIQGGQNWQEFRRTDLARRCKEVEQQERRAS